MDKDINRIKVVLAEKKRTNKWLAEQLGCAPTSVSKWCTNACQPPMETYIKIAEILNITIEELINKEYVNSVSSVITQHPQGMSSYLTVLRQQV